MLKEKSSLLQIRIEPDLLERFKRYSDKHGLHLSVALRYHIKNICDNDDQAEARKKAAREQRG